MVLQSPRESRFLSSPTAHMHYDFQNPRRPSPPSSRSDPSPTMADSRAPAAPPLTRPPILSHTRRTPRHVCFSDLPPKHQHHRNHRSSSALPLDHSDKSCRPFCLSLCAWAFLSIFAFVLLVLLVGTLFASFLHGALPEIAVHGLKFSKLQVQNLTSGKVLDANLEILVEFSNRNEKIAVSFGPLAVEASSERIELGKTKIGAFSQRARNTTELRISTTVEQAGVDGAAAEELVSDLTNSEVVVDVRFRGNAGFHLGSIDIDGIPVLISCIPNKSEVDHGKKSLCSVRIFPL